MDVLLLGLVQLIFINIILSGDNAVVIALASRNLPVQLQKKAVVWGSAGAIILRILLTLVAVWLLAIPYLQIVGGLLLLYIAIKLLIGEDEEQVKSGAGLGDAIRTIIIADLVMSLDNVLAMAGAAHGNFVLIIIGLAISIPIIIWASQLIMKLMERFPVIIYLGAGLLGYTAGDMILEDRGIQPWVESHMAWSMHIVPPLLAILVIWIGHLLHKQQQRTQANL